MLSFWSAVLENDGEDQLDRSCEKWCSDTESQGGEEYRIYNKQKEGYLVTSFIGTAF